MTRENCLCYFKLNRNENYKKNKTKRKTSSILTICVMVENTEND